MIDLLYLIRVLLNLENLDEGNIMKLNIENINKGKFQDPIVDIEDKDKELRETAVNQQIASLLRMQELLIKKRKLLDTPRSSTLGEIADQNDSFFTPAMKDGALGHRSFIESRLPPGDRE